MSNHPDPIPGMSDGEARAFLKAILDSSEDAIISKTLDGRITSWNKGAERLYGWSAGETVGRHISFLIPPGENDLQEVTERIRRTGGIEQLETVRFAKGEREIEVSLTVAPIYGAGGEMTGVSMIVHDISERIRMEQSLSESERRYRTLVEMAPDAVVVHQDGRFVYANCAALGIYGAKSLEDLAHVSLVDLVHPDERDTVRQKIRDLLDGEEIPLREYRLLRINGEEVSIEATSTLIDYQGRPSIQIIARDITERKRSEREREAMLLQLSLERIRLETVLREMQVGVVIAQAPDGRIIYENEQSAQIFRQEPQQADSFADYRKWQLFRLDGSPLPAEEYPVARALRGETVTGEELQIGRGDGSRGFLNVNAAPIPDPCGELASAVAAFSDVTERKLALRALADSEERLKLALDAAEMGSCDIEVASGEGIWSRRHFLLLGYPDPGGESGRARVDMWQSLILPEDRDEVARLLEKARKEGSFFTSEHRVRRADNGELLWVDVKGRFLCDGVARQCRFIGVIFDVSERKAAEEALRRSELRFRVMADSLPQIVWTATPDGTIDYYNAHFELYTGISRQAEDLAGKMAHPERIIAELVHRDDAENASRKWREAIAAGVEYQDENRIRRFDGVYHWHLSRAVPERGENGEVVKWYGTATDVNDLRETQEKLQASEAKFRWLYESNLIGIFFWRRDGTIAEGNSAFCDLVGLDREACRRGGIICSAITPDEFVPQDVAAVDEIMKRGICKPYEKVFFNQSTGEKVCVLIAGARMHDAESDGIGFAVDLTELKRTEEALKTSEATLKLAVETTELGIFDCDLVQRTKKWSEIMKRHFGLPPQAEVTDETCFGAMHPEDRDQVRQRYHAALDPKGDGIYSAEFRTIGVMDGKVRWLTLRGRTTFDEEGVPVRMVGTSLDITEIVKAEKALKEEISERLRAAEELRRQEQLLIRQGRLAAMGEMIGNIAHQWRQPLNTLALIIQELRMYYDRNLLDADYLNSSVTRAMQVINYMSKTIDGFRNFFAVDKDKELFRASEVLSRTVSIVEAAFNELNLKIEVQADPEIDLFGCPNEFSQVILNILVNAKDALVERETPDPRVTVRLYRERGKAVLTVADNAGGIAEEIMDRIFDPYFTTKGPDQGTGIGLFMSKTIIEKNMNGSLTVRNTPDGAEFRIEV